MLFTDCEDPITEEQVHAFEHELGIMFPASLIKHFCMANGGRPEPYIYRNNGVEIVVSECLPLRYGKGSAISVYQNLVAVHRLVPRHFFPFAVDGGGDVLFADCSTLDGSVYLYIHDTAFEHIIALGVGLDGFWAQLDTD